MHPMDDFPVRPLRFDVQGVEDQDLVWSKSSPEFAMFINALGVHVPYFERFLVRVMRAYRDELKDETLKRDVQRIIGQEAHHAFNFVAWNQRLAQCYPGIGRCDAHAASDFEQLYESGNKRFHVGFTAGYETFTFLGGMIILQRFGELMGDAHPDIRALWVWHQVEEVEHGAVAFDFFKAHFPDHEWTRRAMVCRAFGHIAWETIKAYQAILRVERPRFRQRLKAWRFFASFAKDMVVAALPVLRSDYHPRNHPICHEAQSPVAIAWRKDAAEGRDVLSLNNDRIREMLA